MIYIYVHIPTGNLQRVSVTLEEIITYAREHDWKFDLVIEEWELIKIEYPGENTI